MKPISILTLGFLLFWLISPLLSTHNPTRTNPENTLQAPDSTHLFGTDSLGRDVLSRTLHGGQRTLSIALLSLLIAVVPALFLGSASSYAQMLDTIIVMLMTAALAFPSLLFALVILTLLGRGALPIAIATGIAQSPFYFQVVRSLLQQERSRDYIIAAESLGASQWHILIRHILPNARPTLVAYGAVTFSYCIINSAALSLLGLGGDPSIPDWGVMLASGRTAFRAAPWAAIAPAVAISLTVILTNKLADSYN